MAMYLPNGKYAMDSAAIRRSSASRNAFSRASLSFNMLTSTTCSADKYHLVLHLNLEITCYLIDVGLLMLLKWSLL